MKVVIIGSGNAATILGKVIHSKEHEIVQIVSRNINNAKTLASVFNCSYNSFKTPNFKDADIYILAITDTALYHLDQYIHLGEKVVIHTAGSVSQDVLKNVSPNYGIIYPLQSMIKNADHLPEIPLLIDGSTDEVKKIILEFASSLSDNVAFADDDERLKFHVAAVLVNNFTNHLFALADDFCKKESIEFEKLLPLIDETVERIKKYPPITMQTGPAIREDIYTLGKHLQILSSHPNLKYMYLKFSESILKLHQKQ